MNLDKKDVSCGFELLFALTPTLSQRERELDALSLWERVGVRAEILRGN